MSRIERARDFGGPFWKWEKRHTIPNSRHLDLMDRSLGTIDVEKLKFDNHLGDISDDSPDEDEERSKELDGLLQNAFDDLSSIGEDEEELPMDNNNMRHHSSHRHLPQFTNEPNGNLIPSPQPSSSDKDSGTGKSESGLHLRMLLEENSKLAVENEQLRRQNQQMESQVTHLTAKVTTLESSNKALNEAKSDLSKRLELAQATIRSFEAQIEEMAKTEFVASERDYYNRLLEERDAKFSDERLEWFEKEAKLREEVEAKENEVSRLNILNRNLDHKVKILEHLQAASNQTNIFKKHQATSPFHSAQEPRSPTPHTVQSCSCNHQQPTPASDPNYIHRDEVQKMVSKTTETWRQQLAEQFQTAYKEQLTELKTRCIIERENWNSDVKRQVQLLLTWIESMSIDTSTPRNFSEHDLLQPLREVWFVIESKLEEKKKALLEKKREIEEAMQELKDAYDKSMENENSYDASVIQELREQLSKTQAEVEELKSKLQRYKRNYKKLFENTVREREQLKKEFADILREKTKAESSN